MAGDLGFARAGGLMAYSASTPDMFRRAAELCGQDPAGGQARGLARASGPIKFVLVINLKTAQALGLTIPPTLLLPGGRGDPIDVHVGAAWYHGTCLRESKHGVGARCEGHPALQPRG